MIIVKDINDAYAVIVRNMSQNTQQGHKVVSLLLWLIKHEIDINNITILSGDEFKFKEALDESFSPSELNIGESTIYIFDITGYSGGFTHDDLYISLSFMKPDSDYVDGEVYCVTDGHWKTMHADPSEYISLHIMGCIPDVEVEACNCSFDIVALCKKYKEIEEGM